jgi:hypothetical protein
VAWLEKVKPEELTEIEYVQPGLQPPLDEELLDELELLPEEELSLPPPPHAARIIASVARQASRSMFAHSSRVAGSDILLALCKTIRLCCLLAGSRISARFVDHQRCEAR